MIARYMDIIVHFPGFLKPCLKNILVKGVVILQVIGIICEYNPFHLGHKKQIDFIRSRFGKDCAVVCLMSGNYVQRGAPAVFDKSARAKAAILSGADLVLELPVTYALSSAEGFARGGVEILGSFCDYLCFGCETGSTEQLMSTAGALLCDAFKPALRRELDKGLSFPAARAAALDAMGLDAEILRRPNDILAVEYCKAILATGTAMKPLPIIREGSYHALLPDTENPSATSLRRLIEDSGEWLSFVPECTRSIWQSASVHTLEAGQRAILSRLRTMTDAEFEALPYGSEGLWRKFMHACRREPDLLHITAATKSKRYTATRIQRMLLCAFLGITGQTLSTPAPYVRVLALNDTGRAVLRSVKQLMHCINAGEAVDHPYYALEKRCADLYALFSPSPEAPGAEEKLRIYYHRQ